MFYLYVLYMMFDVYTLLHRATRANIRFRYPPINHPSLHAEVFLIRMIRTARCTAVMFYFCHGSHTHHSPRISAESGEQSCGHLRLQGAASFCSANVHATPVNSRCAVFKLFVACAPYSMKLYCIISISYSA
jgi:hypothetical protein